ncbi:hypothetical protein BGZ52_004886, partial [Haplosporangium bisporale]
NSRIMKSIIYLVAVAAFLGLTVAAPNVEPERCCTCPREKGDKGPICLPNCC